MQSIPLSRPDIPSKEIASVMEALSSPNLALGPKMVEFERTIAEYIGCGHAAAVHSGTSSLHLLAHTFGIGEGDEVITTPFSSTASSNGSFHERARSIFIDVEPKMSHITPNLIIKAAITPRTKAILTVDAFDQPARLDEIRDIARQHSLLLIEDAFKAPGSKYQGDTVRPRRTK